MDEQGLFPEPEIYRIRRSGSVNMLGTVPHAYLVDLAVLFPTLKKGRMFCERESLNYVFNQWAVSECIRMLNNS
jgi:hypothetical protein